jgi:hypothetical protein
LAGVERQDVIILMGDMNSQVGNDKIGIEKIAGRHGEGVLNDNGEPFIDLCSTFALTLGGTITAHKRCYKVTWVSPDYEIQNQIDLITTSSVLEKVPTGC